MWCADTWSSEMRSVPTRSQGGLATRGEEAELEALGTMAHRALMRLVVPRAQTGLHRARGNAHESLLIGQALAPVELVAAASQGLSLSRS
jgi:hypothetical protein